MTFRAAGNPGAHVLDDICGVPMDFWKIYDQYYAKVRKFILANVRDEWAADDLIQETFIRIQKNLDSLKDPSKLSSWIFSIAYNLCQDYFRQTRKFTAIEVEDLEPIETFKVSLMQKKLEQHQMGQCIQDKMDLLAPDLRTVLLLSDIMACSQKEIGEILGISVSNVKVRLHRARKKFRAILEAHCSFEVDERNVLVCDPKEEEP